MPHTPAELAAWIVGSQHLKPGNQMPDLRLHEPAAAGARRLPRGAAANGHRRPPRRRRREDRPARAHVAGPPGRARLADHDRPQADRAPLLLDDARVLRRRRHRGAGDAHPARRRRTTTWSRPSTYERAVLAARDHDDLLLHHPDDDGGVRQLPDPADDRRARHGVPAPERAQLLDLPGARAIFLYTSFALGMAPNAGWYDYVPLASRTYDPGPQHRLLLPRDHLQLAGLDADGRPVHRHDPQAARARDVVQPDAAVPVRPARGGASACCSRCRRSRSTRSSCSSTATSAPTSSTSRTAARRCSGSTSSGSSPTPRSTS